MQIAYPLFVVLLYTDPGTGALILQLLAAALIGSMFYLRKFKDVVFVWKERIWKSRKKSGPLAPLDQPAPSNVVLKSSAPVSGEPRGTE